MDVSLIVKAGAKAFFLVSGQFWSVLAPGRDQDLGLGVGVYGRWSMSVSYLGLTRKCYLAQPPRSCTHVPGCSDLNVNSSAIKVWQLPIYVQAREKRRFWCPDQPDPRPDPDPNPSPSPLGARGLRSRSAGAILPYLHRHWIYVQI